MGNHEEMLLEALERVEVLRHFVTYGGKETILSLGVPEATYAEATWDELQTMLGQAFNGNGWISCGVSRRWCASATMPSPMPACGPTPRWRRDCQGSALDSRTFPFQHRRSWCGGGVHGHTISDEPVQRSTVSALIRGPMPRAA
jgi:serine/threonine protein phosphatase 1